jgi:hypothetical protein
VTSDLVVAVVEVDWEDNRQVHALATVSHLLRSFLISGSSQTWLNGKICEKRGG